jgi:hypothetical protein
MSLKFGVYLVEQRIITPEQFCGLVKIQQESTRTLASLAIAHNYLTMKQVSRVLDREQSEGRPFVEIAVSAGLMDRHDATHLLKAQERSGETIRSLAVDCGLLTARQSEVLFNHFLRYGSRPMELKKKVAQTASDERDMLHESGADSTQHAPTPTPKFKRHPIITVEEPVMAHLPAQRKSNSAQIPPK